MPKDAEPAFYERADAHINLSNAQLQQAAPGEVSASMMYATARFNTSLSAGSFATGAEFAAHRRQSIEYFLREYRLALEEHMDEYIANFEPYMERSRGGA